MDDVIVKPPIQGAADAAGTARAPSAADSLLAALDGHGVDFFFANPGTDFPSIIESFACAEQEGRAVPRPVLVPHENAAVSMAHGVTMVTGKPQAVMVHVNVGTGNTLNALMNASRDRVPLLLMAGRSPITEKGPHGARSRHIHWAQEMFDQAGMVRESVKWDYELRQPDQTPDIVARALEMAVTSPQGPVYLCLPREPLAAPCRSAVSAPRPIPAPPAAAGDALEKLAHWIATARAPLIITGTVGRRPGEMEALSALAERFALPVVPLNPRFVTLPDSHPMHQGFQPGPLLGEADLILVLDTDVPWIPSLEGPAPGCRVVHLGEDPTFARYPVRTFPVDLSITAALRPALSDLHLLLEGRLPADDAAIAARRARYGARAVELRAAWKAGREEKAAGAHITPEYLSHCISEAVGPDALIVNEYPLRAEHCPREKPGTYFGLSPAGGLGWGFGAALGAKLAAPERLVVATLGDGAYIFANPTACHWVASAHDLPILAIVFNNALYGAVRNSTLAMYRQGAAAEDGGRLLAELGPSPAYEMLVAAQGGHGERVEAPADLPGALARAVRAVTEERRQALVNVVCPY